MHRVAHPRRRASPGQLLDDQGGREHAAPRPPLLLGDGERHEPGVGDGAQVLPGKAGFLVYLRGVLRQQSVGETLGIPLPLALFEGECQACQVENATHLGASGV